LKPNRAAEALVAQVILRPASGRRITGESIITAETLPLYAPDPDSASAAAGAFAGAGFEVGPLAGVGFSVSGPRDLFERFFQADIVAHDDGGWAVVDPDGSAHRELPLDALPSTLAQRVQAITFEVPAEMVGSIGSEEWEP
jgi:hypothetical protein